MFYNNGLSIDLNPLLYDKKNLLSPLPDTMILIYTSYIV